MENFSYIMNKTGNADQWNQDVKVTLIPIYVILIIYLVIGIFGNTLVLFVYMRKLKNYSEGRYFVPVLAVTDMLSCVVSSCGHASETLLPIIYKVDIACKIERYLRTTTTAFAMLILILIMVDRYLKVCRPYGRQMTKRWKKVFIGIIVIFGLFVSAPCFLFYGPVTKISDDGSINGRRCGSVSAGMPKVVLAWNILIFSCASFELILMSILYFLISRVIFKASYSRKQAKISKGNNKALTSTTSLSNIDAVKDVSTTMTTDTTLDVNTIYALKQDTNDERKQRDKDNKPVRQRASNREFSVSRLTKAFMVITIAFGISFFPTISMNILESTRADFWFTLTEQEYVGIMFLYTFYIFNNIVNPFIYFLLDVKFKQEVIKLHQCLLHVFK